MILSEQQKETIKQHALADLPKECCGLILKNGNVVETKNSSYFPEQTFAINFEDLPSDITLDDISLFYHSHPEGGAKSSIDIYFSHKTNLPSAIYDVKNDSFSYYNPKGHYELPLIGRDFLANEIDCITLVKDFYKRNLNIEIEDIKHPIREIEPDDWQNHPEFWKYNRKDNTAFVELYKERGFFERKDLKKYDIILSDNGLIKALSHIGVYLGDNKVMHHPYPTKSIIVDLSYFEKSSRVLYMRHSSM